MERATRDLNYFFWNHISKIKEFMLDLLVHMAEFPMLRYTTTIDSVRISQWVIAKHKNMWESKTAVDNFEAFTWEEVFFHKGRKEQ